MLTSWILLISALFFLPSAFAESLDFSAPAVSAQDMETRLSACALEREEVQKLRDRITTSADKSQAECANCNTKRAPGVAFGGLHSLATQSLGAVLAPPSKETVYDFSRAIWLQSMKNLMITQVDATLRYQLDGKDGAKPDPEKLFSTFCSRDGDGAGKKDACLAALALTAREKSDLIGGVKKYIQDFSASKTKSLSPQDAQEEVNRRIRKIKDARAELAEIENEFPPSSKQSGIEKSVFLRKKQTKWEERRKKARTQIALTEAQVSSSGPGLLLYTDALSHNRKNAEELPGSSGVKMAISELRGAALAAAGQLNIDIAFATGMATSGSKQGASQAWLDKMIVTNPVAVGQVLTQYPAYQKNLCSLLQSIEKTNAMKERSQAAFHSVMLGTMIVGGVAILPELLSERLVGGIGARGMANFATARAMNGAIAHSAFMGTVGSHIASNFILEDEIEETRGSILLERGATPKDLQAKIREKSENNEALAYDALFLSVPKIAATLKRGSRMPSAIEALPEGDVKQAAIKLASKFTDRQSQAGYQILSMACGTLNADCGLVMAAFQKLPGTPNEKLAKQKEILSSKEKIAAFIKDVFARKVIATEVDQAPRTPEQTKILDKVKTRLGRELTPTEADRLVSAAEGKALPALKDESPELSGIVETKLGKWLKDLTPTERTEVTGVIQSMPASEKRAFLGRAKKWKDAEIETYFWDTFYTPGSDKKSIYFENRLKVLAKSNADPVTIEVEKLGIRKTIKENSVARVVNSRADSNDGRYATVEMTTQGRITDSQAKVKRYTPAEQEKYEVFVKNGKVVDRDGKLVTTKFEAYHDKGSAERIQRGQPGSSIFVMDKEGRIFVSNEALIPEVFHHSTLSGGKSVAAAGEIEIQNGVIVRINDQSGHYHPPVYMTYQFIQELRLKGADLGKAELKLISPRAEAGFMEKKTPNIIPQDKSAADQTWKTMTPEKFSSLQGPEKKPPTAVQDLSAPPTSFQPTPEAIEALRVQSLRYPVPASQAPYSTEKVLKKHESVQELWKAFEKRRAEQKKAP